MHPSQGIRKGKIQAILWILLCKFSFVMMMVIVKQQSYYPTLQLNFLRSLLVMIAVLPLLLKKGWKGFHTKKPTNQMYRVIFGALAMICMFYAYRVLHMAKASALEFSYGLLLPMLSMIFLREKINSKRWVALLIGYVGVWIIINPVYERFEMGEFIMLVSVLLKATSSIHLKKLSEIDPPLLSVFYSGVTTVILLSIYFAVIPYFPEFQNSFWAEWHSLSWEGVGWIFMMSIFSFVAQYSYIQAFCKSQLSFLAGFEYVKMIFATLLGIIVFAEKPTWQTVLGGLVILGSSYLITRQEFKRSIEV